MRLRPIELPHAPGEVAARLQHVPGLVFFDSALTPRGDEISLLAARPDLILQGETDADWADLARELQRRGADGFAAGAVEYGGTFQFGFYPQLLLFSHATSEWSEIGQLSHQLAEPPPAATLPPPDFHAEISRTNYERQVQRALDYIAAGDIYQVNLAHRFQAAWPGAPFSFYQALRETSPAPQAAYLDLGARQILSASPESFLHFRGRQIRTRPIKGTRPRRADPQADERSGSDLRSSPKEIAELTMITDLMRNDLGRLAEWGSVRVTELLVMERFAQVFHLVSTIEATLRAEVSHATALRSCLPGGSISGAPKSRAIEIIAELETAPRGLYTGALGYFGFNGTSAFNLAIRTVIAERGELHFHVGAGIVAESNPAAEYEETLAKAAGIFQAAARLAHPR